jgi:hypothetical protein
VAAGWKSANKLNEKYGVAEKLQGFSDVNADNMPTNTEPVPSPKLNVRDNTLAAKKPPPPTPKKKPALHSITDTGSEPPPLPLASKPKPKVSG